MVGQQDESKEGGTWYLRTRGGQDVEGWVGGRQHRKRKDEFEQK